MPERLSIDDQSIFYGYAHHIQRYELALKYCGHKRVLDAGCGTGYGSYYLSINGAREVIGVDIAENALREARKHHQRPNLKFLEGDCERLSHTPELELPFDVIINLENLEHLNHGDLFVSEARACLADSGTLVVSTPNGDLTERNAQGNIANIYHVHEYTHKELTDLLSPSFGHVELLGQWRTPPGKARLLLEREHFDLLCDLYYHPLARSWRFVKKLLGRKTSPSPNYNAAGFGLPWEFAIAPYSAPPFPWAAEVLIAVCRP